MKLLNKLFAFLLVCGACLLFSGCFESRIEKLFELLESETYNMTIIYQTKNATSSTEATIEIDADKYKVTTSTENYYQILENGMDCYERISNKWSKTFLEFDEDTPNIKKALGIVIFPDGITLESFDLLDGKYFLIDEAKLKVKDLEISNIYVSYDVQKKTYVIEYLGTDVFTTNIYISLIGKTNVTLPKIN